MLLHILTFIFSFRLVHLLQCHGVESNCRIPVEFDEPLPDEKTWPESCTAKEHISQSTCEGHLVVSYTTSEVLLELYGSPFLLGSSESVSMTAIKTTLDVNYNSGPQIRIRVYVDCNTEDFCATNEIRRLLLMFNTMKGRSTDVFFRLLNKILIEPSSLSLSASERNLSCFASYTNTSQQCLAKERGSCYAQRYDTGCQEDSAGEIKIDFEGNPLMAALKPDILSIIYCNRTNCNSLEQYKQVIDLAEAFVLGKTAIASEDEHPPTETFETSLGNTEQPHSKDQSPSTSKVSSAVHQLTRPIYILVSIITATILR